MQCEVAWVEIPLLSSILVSILIPVIGFPHSYVSHLELALIFQHQLFLLYLLLLNYGILELVCNLLQSENVLHAPHRQ